MVNEKLKKTGAKVICATLSVLVLGSNPVVSAKADVPVENIIGDLNYEGDRSQVKENDANQIEATFNQDSSYITNDRIRKAVELSGVLNNYYFSPIEYTNTRLGEVLNLDIDGLYGEYLDALNNGDLDSFCERSLFYKPAIDAYLVFSLGTINRRLENDIFGLAYDMLNSNGDIIRFEMISNIENNISFLVTYSNGREEIVTLKGEVIDRISSLYLHNQSIFDTTIANIGGYSDSFVDCLSYNGVDMDTDESAWLSLGSDDIRDSLTASTEISDSIENRDVNGFAIESDMGDDFLTSEEREYLISIQHNPDYVTKRNVYINNSMELTLK